MNKDFRVGEYYVFSDTKKKVGKATIYGFVQVEEKPYAIMVISGEASTPVARLIKQANDMTYIEVFGGYLYADAPVQPKAVKFQVGKAYRYKTSGGSFLSYSVTTKYTDGGTTYIVLDNRDVLKVGKIEINGDVVEYVDFPVGGILANKMLKEFKEIEE